jgi:hypothetical protein
MFTLRLTALTALLAIVLPLTACTSIQQRAEDRRPIDSRYLPEPDLNLSIDGLGPCNDQADRSFQLKRGAPITVLVHGCASSAGRYRSLAQVFAFKGQQTLCYDYNDRASLDKVAGHLRQTLDSLSAQAGNPEITLIGHSQGGLISRRALTTEHGESPNLDLSRQRLITLSAPFSGIRAADHCASPTARIISLGLVIPLCMAISGDKWFEITHASDFIRKPGQLNPQVTEHLLIATDETESCRTEQDGQCLEDDYVFSLAEQILPTPHIDPVVKALTLKAGHAEIVGNGDQIPEKLIRALEQEGVLATSDPAKVVAYRRLLEALYLNNPKTSTQHDQADVFAHLPAY